ncbi:hypothetical protein N8E89_21270 (plasmid) [Phyllobacterium sp. A18/5-2]|uniref:hypothetical protein n=1 Tax=Phyllobacterium sp. A18/5-2 TaxID=2978392 RepID=UPI0021C6BC57|nr:hypothetical protein [Phyllobacterium sp. A18/5-2]UXN67062.1 hypothetical protein N8E89_21270 [Phyllobacterium sp. A18/5-2]
MKRPYIGYSAQQLEQEFGRASVNRDKKLLKLLHHEFGFRKAKAVGLRDKTAKLRSAIEHPIDLFTVDQESPTPEALGSRKEILPKTGSKPKYRPTPEQDEALASFGSGGSLRIHARPGTLQMIKRSCLTDFIRWRMLRIGREEAARP